MFVFRLPDAAALLPAFVTAQSMSLAFSRHLISNVQTSVVLIAKLAPRSMTVGAEPARLEMSCKLPVSLLKPTPILLFAVDVSGSMLVGAAVASHKPTKPRLPVTRAEIANAQRSLKPPCPVAVPRQQSAWPDLKPAREPAVVAVAKFVRLAISLSDVATREGVEAVPVVVVATPKVVTFTVLEG